MKTTLSSRFWNSSSAMLLPPMCRWSVSVSGIRSWRRHWGGKVAKYAGGWAVGAQDYSFDTGPVRLNAWHQDQVITPPDGAQTVASNAFCAHAALLYPGRGFSVQAHPEFEDGVIQGLIDHRGPGVVPDPLLQQAQAGLGRADSRAMADRIAAFFKQHAGVRA